MKKILSFVMLIVFTVLAVGCDPATYHFDVEVYGEQVEKIELRYSELNGTPEMIEISDGAVPEFHLDETYLVETLDVDKNLDFCNDLALVTFHRIYECVNKPFGYILVLYLSNKIILCYLARRMGIERMGFLQNLVLKKNLFNFLGVFAKSQNMTFCWQSILVRTRMSLKIYGYHKK